MKPDDAQTAAAMLPAAPLALEGYAILHQMFRIRRATWRALEVDAQKRVVAEAASLLSRMQQREDGEEFNAFVDRVGTKEFEARIEDLVMPIEFSLENMNYFVDWSRSGPFQVQRGEGECAV